MWCKIFLCALLCHLGHSVKILSTGRTINVQTQQTQEIKMDCSVQFEGQESYLANLVYWFKIQNFTILNTFRTGLIITTYLNRQDTTISPELNTAIGAVEEISALLQQQNPFDDLSKFMVTNVDSATKQTVFSLTIKSLVPQDSGLYVCAVKQSGNNPVLTADFSLNILQPVTNVVIMGAPEVMKNMTNMNRSQDSSALVYHEEVNGYFVCKSEGGFPAPHLSVFIGDQRVSGFGLNDEYTNYTLIGNLEGRQTINSVRWVNSTTFRVNREMNNKKVKCVAEIRTANSTFQNTTAEKMLMVYYKPKIDCKESEIQIPLGGADIPVKCDIHARPTPEITWTAKSSDVKVKSNDNTRNNLGLKAATEVATGGDNMIATLTFDEVRNEHFQQYDIVAENVVGSALITVTIKNGELRVKAFNSASSLSSLALLTTLLAALQLLVTFS